MSRRRLVSLASVLVALALLQLLNLLFVESKPPRIFNSNLIQALSAILAAGLLIVVAVRLRRQDSRSATGWTFIAAAACLWALGMISFMILEVGLVRHAYPGFPDAFFFVFYPIVIYGLIKLPQDPLSREEKLNSAINIAVLTVLTAMSIWQFNIEHLVRNLIAQPSLASQFSLAYTLLDMLFLSVLFVTLARQVVHSSQFASRLALVVGCFCLAVADLMQAHITLYTEFVSGSMADLGWVLFSVLVGLSATIQLASSDTAGPDAQSPHLSFAGRTIFVTLIAYLWLGTMLVLLLWEVFQPHETGPYFLVAGVFIVFGLALYRQMRGIEENVALYGLLEQARADLETRVRERTEELQAQTQRLLESEKTLQKSEEKYRELVETTGTGYLIVDLQGRVIDANAEYVRLTGRQDLNEIVGHSVLEWTAPYDVERNELEIRKCIEECSVRNLVIDYVSAEGHVTPIEINATLVDTADDMVIITLCRDISERRQAEEALRLTQFSVEHSSDAAYWIDQEARFVYVNEAACRSHGYTREELLGMTVFDIDPVFTQEQWDEAWRELEKLGSRSLETMHRNKRGDVFPVEITTNFLEFGGKKYDFAFARNISERKRTEEDKRHFYRETIKSVTQGKLDLASFPEVKEYLDSAELTASVASVADAATARHEIKQFCASIGLGDDRLALFETAVGEAITNAVKHARECRVYAGAENDSIWVAISDKGSGISTLTLPGATLRKGFSTKASLGMGYSIMMEGTDVILLCTGSEGTTVVLTVETTAPESILSLADLRDTWDDITNVAQRD